MRYQEIRDAFKKCGIIIGSDGIAISFPTFAEPQFTTLSVDSDEIGNKKVFEELLRVCDSVRIDFIPGEQLLFWFCMDVPVERDVFFQPICKEKSREEIERIIANGPRSCDFDFAKTFHDINLSSEDDILCGVSDYLRLKNQDKVVSFERIRSWPALLRSSELFYDECKFGDISVEEPDEYSDYGCVLFDVVSQNADAFKISGAEKQAFEEMLLTSNWFSLEGFSSEEYAELILTVYS